MHQKSIPLRAFLLLTAITGVTSLTVWGAQLAGDVSEDSEIVLVETHGSVSTFRVTTVGSQTTVTFERDGEVLSTSMPHEECLSLWQFCLDSGAEELGDAQATPLPPDVSQFALTFRIGESSHSFTVDGVDFLDDTRYRDIVRRILAVCQRYLEGRGTK